MIRKCQKARPDSLALILGLVLSHVGLTSSLEKGLIAEIKKANPEGSA
jgi:hypothetical protein